MFPSSEAQPESLEMAQVSPNYSVLDNVKNTSQYWRNAQYELFARLEIQGPFTFFFTLYCTNVRLSENFTSLLEVDKITYESEYGQESFYVDDQPLKDFHPASQNRLGFIKDNLTFQHWVKRVLPETGRGLSRII
jgi:hypothetical protein